MSHYSSNQEPASPKSRAIPSSSRNEILDEGLWLKTKDRGSRKDRDPKKCKKTFDQGITETVFLPPSPTNRPAGCRGPSQDAPAGSSLENTTDEDRLKLDIYEGMDINHCLALFDETVSKTNTAETPFDNKESGNDINKFSIHKFITPLDGLGNRIEDYGGMDASDCLPPFVKAFSGDDTPETETKNKSWSADSGGIPVTFGLPKWDEDKFKQLIAEDQQQEVIVMETTHATTSNISYQVKSRL